jgi:hypothetical protein
MFQVRGVLWTLLAVFLLFLGGAGIAGACSKPAPEPAAAAVPAAAPKLVIDRGHGQTADVSGLINVPASQGCTVSDVQGHPADAVALVEALNNCSLFVVTQPATRDFSPEEVAAVQSYVANGGGLWVLYDADGPGAYNALPEPFGVTFDGNALWENDWSLEPPQVDIVTISIPTVLQTSHPELFAGVNDLVYFRGVSLNGTSPGTPPALPVVVTADSDVYGGPYNLSPVLAAGEVGSGRVVFIGDTTPLAGSMWDGLGDGNKQLLNNIFAWLKKPVSASADPPNPQGPPTDDPIPVRIKIRPWSKVNKIDLNSKGFVRVAVLTTPDFDANDVDRNRVDFAGASPVCAKLVNVDRNKGKDLLLLFHIPDLNLPDDATDAKVKLRGWTKCDQSFEGEDSVQVTPKKKCKKPPQTGRDCGGRGK